MGSKSQQQVQVTPSASAAILVVMYIAAFVAAFNENIINVALHDIMAAFSVSATTAQWLVSGYMIVTSIFTAIMAFLSGRFSTCKLLFFACGCMVAGEVLCLVAPSFSVLLPSRILQAAGSGILFPLMMNVVLSCASREKLGLYLSLGGACITAFVYSVGEFSTNLIAGIVALFAAIVLLGLFAARQLKLEHPVLNVRPMASVRFWPACLLVVVSMMTTFSMSVLLPLYFEGAYGMTALIAGLLILPAIACNSVTSIVGGRVTDARGAWPLLPVGFALIAVGQTAISMTAASMNIGVVVALTVVVYAGVGLVLSPSQTAGLETLPAAEHPHGTALLNTWNMIAASFGPSLFIGLLSSSAATAGAAGAATDVAQAIGFAAAVRVAAVIAVVGFVASLVYARRESHMSH
jgi:predicted MFS family arabinose efflux permease